jgi:hypothetical protein
MNNGATTWFRVFGAKVWNLLIIEPFFYWNFEKPRLKTILEIGGVLGIVGKPSPCNKVDFLILKPKMWTILLNFWWVRIVVGNSNKLQKGVWKENSIECIQTWVNDIGYNSV